MNEKIQEEAQRADSPRQENADLVMSVAEASKFLRYSESQLYKDVEERRIPFIQKGRRVLFLKNDLLEWLQTMRKPAIN